MTILLVNGPNLSQLGTRDEAMYGSAALDEIVGSCRQEEPDLDHFVSDSEGELITRLHAARVDGTTAVVLNPGALTHYGYALRDAVELLDVPVVEVHLSHIHAREAFRRVSVVSPVVNATITGVGAYGYVLAVCAARHLTQRGSRT